MGRITSFGEISGTSVPLISLSGPDGIRLEAIGYGAALRALSIPDKNGRIVDLCLGYDTLAEYQANDGCLGATVGRCANRIAGASFSIGGERFSLEANESGNTLHSASAGFHHRVWEVLEMSRHSVVFRLRSPHLDGGFPGNLEARITYALVDGPTLVIHYEAVSDRDTVVNLTNHSYWNLSGVGSRPALEQRLTLFADRFTPAGPDNIPTGALQPVAGTPLDFSRPAIIGARINHPMLTASRGYDHNYELPGTGLRKAALLESAATGIAMSLYTTLPGLQLYSANYLTERRIKGGAICREQDGLCLETQFFPDAVHHPAFVSPILPAGERYSHCSEYRFG